MVSTIFLSAELSFAAGVETGLAVIVLLPMVEAVALFLLVKPAEGVLFAAGTTLGATGAGFGFEENDPPPLDERELEECELELELLLPLDFPAKIAGAHIRTAIEKASPLRNLN
jgi:hypothetical protein